MAKMLYQGHGSYRLTAENGFVIYVDPYVGKGYNKPADLVLVSHEHSDHNNVALVRLKSDGMVFRSSDLLSSGNYKTVRYKDVKITATPAYNQNHQKNRCVGFLIELDGVKIYAAGDTSKTDYMTDVLSKEAVDYAILPIDGVYNMGPEEASECAKIIAAKHSIPVHMKPGSLFDREKAEQFTAGGRIILEPGEEIKL